MDLMEWACGMMDRDNRKSHLAPQLSPATQELLRSGDTYHGDDRSLQTPTCEKPAHHGPSVRPTLD